MKSNSMEATAMTEADLQRSIEQWRMGDLTEAHRVWCYIHETYRPAVLRKIAHTLRVGSHACDANNDGEDPDENRKDLERTDMGHEDDRQGSEPVGDGHRAHEQCDAKVLNGDGSRSGHSDNQLHDYAIEGGLQLCEEVDLMLSRRLFVTKNEQPGAGCETYTGNYSGRRALGRRNNFEWKGMAAFGKLVMDIWVKRSIDSFRKATDHRLTRTVDPQVIDGDLPDAQRFQEAVYSKTRPIDLFLRDQLEGRRGKGGPLSARALMAVLNRLIDGEPLWHKPELGGVDFDGLKVRTGFKPTTQASQRRANRAVLVAAYPGLIIHVTERAVGRGNVPIVQVQAPTDEDVSAASAHTAVGDRQILPREQLTVSEAAACAYVTRKLLHEALKLSELRETLPEESPARRLVEGLIVYRKQLLWNASPARPAFVWTSGAAVTEEERTLFDEIRRTSIEQLIKEADFPIFLDDPRENRQPLYVEASKFILRYGILDLQESERRPMKTLENTYVHAPKVRLRNRLEPIVPWFYRERR